MAIPRLKLKRIGNMLQIVEQEPRYFKFRASNDFRIKSEVCPQFDYGYLFVRGDDQTQDLRLFQIIPEEYDRLKQALAEYNKLLDYKFIEEDEENYEDTPIVFMEDEEYEMEEEQFE